MVDHLHVKTVGSINLNGHFVLHDLICLDISAFALAGIATPVFDEVPWLFLKNQSFTSLFEDDGYRYELRDGVRLQARIYKQMHFNEALCLLCNKIAYRMYTGKDPSYGSKEESMPLFWKQSAKGKAVLGVVSVMKDYINTDRIEWMITYE